MKNRFLILFLFFSFFLVTGCDEEYKIVYCTRSVEDSSNNISASMRYELYYDSNYYVRKSVSNEEITSTSSDVIEEYKKAYEDSFKAYKDLSYYTNTITVNDNTLTSLTIIDYDKVDSKKILKIEGDDGNIFTKDGKVKLDTLIERYQKTGSKCYGN